MERKLASMGSIVGSLLACGMLISTVHAQVTIDTFPEWDGSTTANSWGPDSTRHYGQTLTVPSGFGLLSSYRFAFGEPTESFDFTLNVAPWTGTTIGTPVYTSALLTFVGPGSGNFVEFTVSDIEVVLTPGAEYVVYVSADQGGSGSAGQAHLGPGPTNVQSADPLAGQYVFSNDPDPFAVWDGLSDYASGDTAFTAVFLALLDLTGSDLFASLGNFGVESTSTFIRTSTNHLRHKAMSGPDAPGGGSAAVSPAMISSAGGFAMTDTLPLPLSYDYGWDVWAQGYGEGGDIGESGVSGINYGTGGLAAGVDRWFSHETLLGLFGGWADSNVDLDTGLAGVDAENWRVGLHGLHRFANAYLMGSFHYGDNQYSGNRNTIFGNARSDFDGNEWGAYLEGGMPIFVESTQWKIQPLIAYQYLNVEQDGFTETGAGVGNLTFAGQSTDSHRLSLGVFLARDLFCLNKKVTPYLDLRWTKELGDNDALINGTTSTAGAFQVPGFSLGDDFIDVSAGTVIQLCPNTQFTLGYEGRFSEDSSFSGGVGQIRVNF